MIKKLPYLVTKPSEADMLTPANIAEYLFYVTKTFNEMVDTVNRLKQRERQLVGAIWSPYKDDVDKDD